MGTNRHRNIKVPTITVPAGTSTNWPITTTTSHQTSSNNIIWGNGSQMKVSKPIDVTKLPKLKLNQIYKVRKGQGFGNPTYAKVVGYNKDIDGKVQQIYFMPYNIKKQKRIGTDIDYGFSEDFHEIYELHAIETFKSLVGAENESENTRSVITKV